MSTALQIIFLLSGALLIRASKKPNPRQKIQKYFGTFLLIFVIISFIVDFLK
ncbi:hypothetical protein LGMK_06805 [Leuconostoc sp. C2]|uniref:Uncharacterized protein n=1 Tax=Leuconostoc kimchii (strain IMSNU 11154 / KCTC 2386 / IH25) TaxID=762051 RepID=D5T2V8_LEUKI|nr:hypothetical protein LKI_05330 [Leuconostoc kimchii IMSNU 11154]AEJ31411.1 hypothetical protein LGMK_06805 [Leuconostoc sp. C2]